MEKNVQNIYLTYYNLWLAHDLWQAYYQILSIIFLKDFIKLNLNMDMKIETVKLLELTTTIATVFLNRQILKVMEMFVL